MAEASFDVEAGVDRQEVDNAINQAARETVTRFDFKDTDTIIEWAGDEGIKLESVSEDRVKAALEVLRDKCVKRKVSLKALDIADPRDAGGGRSRIDVKLVNTMTPELAKAIVKDVKASKLKVTPTNMGDRVRIAGKSKDDLQAIQTMITEADHPAPPRYTNSR